MKNNDLKQCILELLTVDSLNINEITEKIEEHFSDVIDVVKDLMKESRVRMVNNTNYVATNYIEGTLSINLSGNGFVCTKNNKRIFIPKICINGAVNGDKVLIDLDKRDLSIGKIVSIIRTDKVYEIGTVVIVENKKYIRLDDKKDIILPLKEDENIVEGHRVKIKLGSPLSKKTYDYDFVGLIGHINDPRIDIINKAASFDVDLCFPKEVLEEADKIPNKIRDKDFEGRRDLSNKPLVTIDPSCAKDYDDAFALEILPNGNKLMTVCIASVDDYVIENGFIDMEARRRGFSCYPLNWCIPMLPPKLSSGICSLLEGEYRLTKTIEAEYDKNGYLVDYAIYLSVMKSKKRMTYEKVQRCLDGDDINNTYTPFIPMLESAKDLADIIGKSMNNKGKINFDKLEPSFITDERGKVIDILERPRLESEKIIEIAMLEANRIVAMHMRNLGVPYIYRNHDLPRKSKIIEIINFSKIMGDKLGKIPQNMHPKVISGLLNTLKGNPNFDIYSNLLLRAMARASYSGNCLGHFGLSFDVYSQFTSPIRRYPDLFNHRMVRAMLDGKHDLNNEKIYSIADYASRREQVIDECERAINKMKLAEFMSERVGNEYVGKIVMFKECSICVRFYNGVDGTISFRDLGEVYYDNERYTLYTKHGIFKIGDIIDVEVKRADKEAGFINLFLANKEQVKPKVRTKERQTVLI